MNGGRVVTEARSFVAQCLMVGIAASAVQQYLWEYPVPPVGLALGAVIGVGNGLRWWGPSRKSQPQGPAETEL